MLYTIAHIFISPINQSLFGICLGMAFLTFTKLHRWIGKGIVWVSIIWVALCSQYFFSYWLMQPLEKAFAPVQAQSKQWQGADAIWVLACYHFDAESLPIVSQFNHCSTERLVQAAIMYRLKPTPIYLTGGDFNETTKLSYASQASKLLLALGVNTTDIRLLDIGKNTVSEAKELIKHTKHQKLAVISSASHGVRLSEILARRNIEFIFVPVHYATKGENIYTLNPPSTLSLSISERAMYEYAALVKYWLFE